LAGSIDFLERIKVCRRNISIAQLYANAAAAHATPDESAQQGRTPRCVATRFAKTYHADAHSKGENRMKKLCSVLIALAFAVAPIASAAAQEGNDTRSSDRLRMCGEVMNDIVNMPDSIPQTILDRAVCVAVIPSVMKAAFMGGGLYGRGAMTCRSGENFNGPWSAPTMMRVEGGSFGAQIGVQATDLVLLIMPGSGAESLLNSRVKIGADASAAAGPVGRAAEADSDAYMRAEILSYSRARGLFAGVALVGSTLRQDEDANMEIYGKKYSAMHIVRGGDVQPTPEAMKLLDLLNKFAPPASHAAPAAPPAAPATPPAQ
jgi:lipid-binding SYLF domain-containing protein